MIVTAVGLYSQKGMLMKLLGVADEDASKSQMNEIKIVTASQQKIAEPTKKTSILEAKLRKLALKIGYIGKHLY